jgi:thiol-disulfide isomerase/thioredoxin
MSPGLALFLGIVSVFAVLGLVQWAFGRRARALQGQPVPDLPSAHADLAEADIVVWFHSPTCGPCKAMEPFVDALVEQGRARSVDVSTDLDVAMAFGVMATPTTIRLQNGRVTAVRTGGMGPTALEEFAA